MISRQALIMGKSGWDCAKAENSRRGWASSADWFSGAAVYALLSEQYEDSEYFRDLSRESFDMMMEVGK